MMYIYSNMRRNYFLLMFLIHIDYIGKYVMFMRMSVFDIITFVICYQMASGYVDWILLKSGRQFDFDR